METASIELPTVNIGIRQKGRERPPNIIDSSSESKSILQAVEKGLSDEFRDSLKGMTNLYGDGRASERIVKVLSETELGEKLLIKKAVLLDIDNQQ